MPGNGVQMNDPRNEDHRKTALSQASGQPPDSGDPPWITGPREERQAKIVIADRGGRRYRQTVSGRAYHHIERARSRDFSRQAVRIGHGVSGRPARVEEEPAIVETTYVEAYGSGIDPHDPWHS